MKMLLNIIKMMMPSRQKCQSMNNNNKILIKIKITELVTFRAMNVYMGFVMKFGSF